MARVRLGSTRSVNASPAAAAGCLGLFGLFFAAAGVLFAVIIAIDFAKSVETRGWDEVSATLTGAEVEVSRGEDQPFAIRVTYDYRVGDRDFSSDQYSLKERRSDSYEELALELKELRVRRELTAYVDPDDPGIAVLRRESLATGLMILLPLVFVAVGVGCLVGAVRMARRGKATEQNSAGETPISSSPTKRQQGAWVGIIVGVAFAAAGLGLLYPLAFLPLARAQAAKSWVETPCKVIWANVKSHDSDDGTTYSVDVFYAYEFEGVPHRSNRYKFVGGSSSGRKSKQKVVDHYRESESPVCYVDPEVPERAVLKRELGAGSLLALIPVVLILIGAPLVIHCMRLRSKERASAAVTGGVGAAPLGSSQRRAETSSVPASPAGERTFSPGGKRFGTALVLLLVALFWNGIVFGFLFQEAWLGDGGLFLKLFSIPFILVGVILALVFVHNALAIFNPQAILTLVPGEPELGVPTQLKWRFKGSTGRLRRFRIIVRGIERASYRRGTDTVTDERAFYALALCDESHAMSMHSGSAAFTLPHDLMYSLVLGSNAICWRIEVKGEISFWPDLDDKYDLTVRPYPLNPTRPA